MSVFAADLSMATVFHWNFIVMRFDDILKRIEPLRCRLLEHELYAELCEIADIRTFMDHHVFAVWDFMSLLKALQRKLTCTQTPWLPPADPFSCRLINEIALCEESDIDRNGGYASHFELYLRAMRACGASTVKMELFLKFIAGGDSVDQAMRRLDIPHAVRSFVGHTMLTVRSSQCCELAAAFAFGRESLIPDLFTRIVDDISRQDADGILDEFRYYLDRHVEVDGDQHGPMAQKMVESICGDDQSKWKLAESSAIRALDVRLRMWDAMLHDIRRHRSARSGRPTNFASISRSKEQGVGVAEAAVQLAWLDGMSVDEIGSQSNLSADSIRLLLNQDRSQASGGPKLCE